MLAEKVRYAVTWHCCFAEIAPRAAVKSLDSQRHTLQLETAYDTLLMQAMQKRIAGEVAGQSVRFADVPKRRPAGQVHSCPCILSGH